MKWFKSHNYPDFWNDYASHFKTTQTQDIERIRFVVFDTETTGLDPKTDRILSIGTVAIINKKIKVRDQLEIYLEQSQFNADTVKIHGLLKTGKLRKVNEQKAVKLFLKHIENAVLVAHHAAFDIAMINAALKRMDLPKLKNKVLDTGHLFQKIETGSQNLHYSLDYLCEYFNVPKHDRHTASGDAYITALLFLKVLSQLNAQTLKTLMRYHKRIGLL